MAQAPILPHAGEALSLALPGFTFNGSVPDAAKEPYLRVHGQFSLLVARAVGPASRLTSAELVERSHSFEETTVTLACAQAPLDEATCERVPNATRRVSRSLTITTPRLSRQTGEQSIMFYASHLNNELAPGDDNCLEEAAEADRMHNVLFRAPAQFPSILRVIGLERDDPHLESARHLASQLCPVTAAIPVETERLEGYRRYGDAYIANRGLGVGIALLQRLITPSRNA